MADLPTVPLPEGFLTAPLAHRALHDLAAGRPENSRAAIGAAVTAGYGIEIDVQLSRDGTAMIFHDYDLRRLTGEPGAVAQRSAAELSAIPLLGGREGIPTLAEGLACIAGRVPLLIEMKDQTGALAAGPDRLERAVAEALEGYEGPVAVMSFNPHAVAAFGALRPDLPRGLTTDAFDDEEWGLVPAATRARLRGIPDVAATGAGFISHDVRDLASPRVAALKSQGLHVLCWTVRSPAQEAEARRVADNITFEGYAPAAPGA
ncbi:Glycerophosphoryl diester phosphodiesterase [Pseudoruegeria aquimaris]|uniref:Glycerophosphoryl diester phosphodiesterase n=1 Tax=Pseudoruegeria aquimaris TaxID=393663 RepID=A0A1Y5TLL1_9RHOB|nr:glycerophosphodiester phosphodiesterase family protein [Pseudoruegeria aquimaris]SLN64994.1 Glycerophosphoryl diester phosphodiesterase [Pseudoruegeria aquimaris]